MILITFESEAIEESCDLKCVVAKYNLYLLVSFNFHFSVTLPWVPANFMKKGGEELVIIDTK